MPITINGTTGVSGVDGTAAAPSVQGADSNTGVFFPAADTVAVSTAGTERLRVTSVGLVGIGTTPTTLLHLSGSAAAGQDPTVTLANTTATTGRTYQIISGDGGPFRIQDATAAAERMRIDSSGNVGIGGSVPASNPKLSMYGGIRFLANETAAATYTGIGSIASDTVSISTSGTERLNIGTGGLITQLNATSGRGAIVGEQTFQLAANGTAIGPGIADFFGATSSINLEASSLYQITGYLVFTKNTAGTITGTMTASSAPTRMVGVMFGSPATGIGAASAAGSQTSLTGSQSSTTASFPVGSSLTTGVNHVYQFRMEVQTNAATNWRFQVTQSAGTVTPLAGSYYTVKKISASTGTFV
jgi:hypothetical protein